MRSAKSPGFALFLTCAVFGGLACDQLRTKPLDLSEGFPSTKHPIEARQITGPKLDEAIRGMGGRTEASIESEEEERYYVGPQNTAKPIRQ